MVWWGMYFVSARENKRENKKNPMIIKGCGVKNKKMTNKLNGRLNANKNKGIRLVMRRRGAGGVTRKQKFDIFQKTLIFPAIPEKEGRCASVDGSTVKPVGLSGQNKEEKKRKRK